MSSRQRTRSAALLLSLACALPAALPSPPAAAQGPPSAPAGVRVAVINVQRLILDSEEGKQAVARLEKLREEKEAEIAAQQRELRGLRQRLAEGRLSLSAEKVADLEKELEKSAVALRELQAEAESHYEREQEEAFQGIEEAMMPIIREVGEELGYALIFNKYNSGLLFALEEVDITGIILERYERRRGAGE